MNQLVASFLLAAMAFWTLSVTSAAAQEQIKGVPLVTLVYIARGAADVCGAGCNRWIAVEGKIDEAAAGRLRRVLQSPQARGLPILLHSPGGNARQSLAMGRMLRERKVAGRVARTLVKECGSDQASPDCVKLKQGGKELEAEITTTQAHCSSGCTFLLMGAATREVAFGVGIGVHLPGVTLNAKLQAVPKATRERAVGRALDSLNRDMAAYIVAMGIDRRLFDLIKTVRFESMHALTRDEIFRFGIDKREMVETDWSFNGAWIEKLVQARGTSTGKEFRIRRWRIMCGAGQSLLMSYARNNRDEPLASAALRFGADQKIVLGAFEQAALRTVTVEAGMVEKLKVATQLSLMEVGTADVAAGAERSVEETVLSTSGLAQAIEQLWRACRPQGRRG